MNFTAIDFETATRSADSACQLAAVRVRDNRIVHRASWLIRPRPLRFAAANIGIHGITPAMVRDEPEFGDLWPDIRQTIGDDCIIAHNASFDLGVLLACLSTHDQPIPDLQYSCTRAIARRTWPHLPRFGLKPLSDWLGITFRHHDALEDSIACAKIAIAAAEDRGADSLEDLERQLALIRGSAGSWGKRGPAAGRGRGSSHARSTANVNAAPRPIADPWRHQSGTDLQRLLVRAEFIRPLAGQCVVFTGTLTRIDRADAEDLIVRCGGQCQSSVTATTSLVVVGQTDERTLASGRLMSVQEETAREHQTAGRPLRIVNEDEFLSLVIVAE